ncbi:MAG TPA: Flp pilus assembly protein CpaB [Gemmataceae bacterium]|jgi:pilus assembly protein CpaB
MKSKTFVMMFLAIGCGLVAAYLTARISARQATPDTQPVLVAKEKILAGQVIKDPEKSFVLMPLPTGSAPNAISNLEDLKNKIVNKTIQTGQWLTPDDISGNFGIDLPKGYYAMSVKVDAVSGASGFILPKSRVNVVATIKPTGMGGRPKVVTILQDVLVLAVDQTSVRPEDRMAVSQLSTALLAVKPADSQKLALAQSMGDLKLVLRAHDDENKVPLPPQEYVDTDTFVDDGTGTVVVRSAGDSKPKFKLAVAKQDLEAGTVINNPEDFFTVKSFPESIDKAITAEELASLKGKTVRHSLFKDGVLTAKHFEGDEPAPTVIAPPVKKHTMFIQNGGSAPVMVTYRDGVAEGADTKDDATDPKEAKKPQPTGETK